jgi:hypothetical protein
MKLKILEFRRGQSKQPVICENNDVYDSEAELFDFSGKSLYISEHWNTDSTKGYNGGKLAKGTYFAIKGKRTVSYHPDPIDVLKIFSPEGIEIENIKSEDDIPEKNWTLPSEIPNPNHENKMIMDFVQVHSGGLKWDYSWGCLTGLNVNGYVSFDVLNRLIADKEIVIIRLV